MPSVQKRLNKMRANQKDWRIEDLKSIADSLNIEYRSSGGSHVVFRSPGGNHATVPAKRPIKPIYIKQFLDLVSNSIEEGETDNANSEEQI